MAPNLDKVDDTVLALLHLVSFQERQGEFTTTRAWKSHDWDALDQLHAKGLISDPRNKNKSVCLTEEGAQRAETLFNRLFGDS